MSTGPGTRKTDTEREENGLCCVKTLKCQGSLSLQNDLSSVRTEPRSSQAILVLSCEDELGEWLFGETARLPRPDGYFACSCSTQKEPESYLPLYRPLQPSGDQVAFPRALAYLSPLRKEHRALPNPHSTLLPP